MTTVYSADVEIEETTINICAYRSIMEAPWITMHTFASERFSTFMTLKDGAIARQLGKALIAAADALIEEDVHA